MIGLAQMGANTLCVQRRHHINRGHVIDIKRHQPFARGIIGAPDDMHPRHFRQAGQVAGTVDHRIRQCRFMGMDRLSRRNKFCPTVSLIRHLGPEPFKITHHLRQGGISAGVTGAQFPIVFGAANQHIMRQRPQAV